MKMSDKIKLVLSALLLLASMAAAFYIQPVRAQTAQPQGVGGIFLPGLTDIFTPSLVCGTLVTVAGPAGGVFVWAPARIYDWFALATVTNPPPSPHVGLWMLGYAIPNPVQLCPPILTDVGSGLHPGF